MSEVDVVEFMYAAKSRLDWKKRCEKVKSRYFGKYPDFWHNAIVVSGVERQVSLRF